MPKPPKPYERKIFLIIAALLIACTGAFYFHHHSEVRMTNSPRTITAVLAGSLSIPLSPENISTVPLYQIHLNLWDTIISAHGEPAIARLLESSDKKVFRFEIQPEARFSNGRKIESSDILFSINRLLSRQESGHFNVKELLEKVSVTSSSTFEINLKEPAASFLFLLSLPEMGIVPKEACKPNGDIESLHVTSGAYTVEGSPQSDRIVLVKNPNFKRNEPSSPEKVNVIFRRGVDQIVQSAHSDHADFIELYESSASNVLNQLKNSDAFAYKATRPSNSIFLLTNPKKLATNQRLAIAELIHNKFAQYFQMSPELETPSFEVSPPKTFGSLELQAYPKLKVDLAEFPKNLKLACYDKTSPLVGALVKIFEDSKAHVELVDAATNTDYDVILFGQGMNLDFPEIEFHLMMVSPWASVASSDSEKKMIIKAIHSNDRNERSDLIRKINQAILDDGRVIPLLVRSYVHVYRKNSINIDGVTKYDGDVPFWLMKAGTP